MKLIPMGACEGTEEATIKERTRAKLSVIAKRIDDLRAFEL